MVLAAYRQANGKEALKEMAKVKQFQPVVKPVVRAARDVLQARFDGRHGVYLQSFLDLSRSKSTTLNNATFNTYHHHQHHPL